MSETSIPTMSFPRAIIADKSEPEAMVSGETVPFVLLFFEHAVTKQHARAMDAQMTIDRNISDPHSSTS
jgi:hypothetical protein